MRITDVQAFAFALPVKQPTPPSSWTTWLSKQVVIRVQTDSGLVGWGEAFPYGAPGAIGSVIEDGLAPVLRGEDPARIELLADRMQRAAMNYGRRGLGMFAISGIEIALWDLLGKAHGVPVYQLLGGAVRRRFPAYGSLPGYDSPEDVAAACAQSVAAGFQMLKLHQTDLTSFAAARTAVGPDVELMLDTNCPWTPAEAIAMARALEPYRPFWLEEPVWPPEDYDGLARVRGATTVPIACGENEATVFGFREIIARGAADILQPSVTKVGGVSEFKKIAALAAAANLPVVPHSFYYGPGLAATLHVAATLPGTMPVEIPTVEQVVPIATQPIEVHQGWVEVSDAPGLGVDVSLGRLEPYPYSAANAAPFALR